MLDKNTIGDTQDNTTSVERIPQFVYADDLSFVANESTHLQCMVDIFVKIARAFNLFLNIPKCHSMVIQRHGHHPDPEKDLAKQLLIQQRIESAKLITIEGKVVDYVKEDRIIGSIVAEDGKMTREINKACNRMHIAFFQWATHSNMANRHVALSTRLRTFDVLVCGAALYACGSWNQTKEDEANLDSMHFSLLKRVMYISDSRAYINKDYKSIVSFLEVVRRAAYCGVQIIPISIQLKVLQLRYIGHILRKPPLTEFDEDGKEVAVYDARGNVVEICLQKILLFGKATHGTAHKEQGSPPRISIHPRTAAC